MVVDGSIGGAGTGDGFVGGAGICVGPVGAVVAVEAAVEVGVNGLGIVGIIDDGGGVNWRDNERDFCLGIGDWGNGGLVGLVVVVGPAGGLDLVRLGGGGR